MSDVHRIDSITQLHDEIGYPKPLHPLITLIDFGKIEEAPALTDVTIVSSLYSIAMKSHNSCELMYGRGTYDFEESALIFMGPEQRVQNRPTDTNVKNEGWGLYFHPDLIRGHAIQDSLDEFSFFGYESSEALHVSEREKESVVSVIEAIETEYSLNPDDHSLEIILSNLELLLRYCKRFYSRQFNTRKSINKSVVQEFNKLLKAWFDLSEKSSAKIPTVKYFADELNYSPNYLGDLLKKETGRSTQDHIYAEVIERAKNLLLNPDISVSQVAYSLGFEYPQHFSKLFKSKTGQSPNEWRN